MRIRPLASAVLAVVCAATIATTGSAQGLGALQPASDPPPAQDSHAIGLWGDLPYSSEQATAGVPHLIADMNSQKLAFTAHDGDLKAGSGE